MFTALHSMLPCILKTAFGWQGADADAAAAAIANNNNTNDMLKN